MMVNLIKNQYLVILSCMFFSKAIVLVCSVRCHMIFLLMKKLRQIVIKMILFPHSNQRIGLNLFNMFY